MHLPILMGIPIPAINYILDHPTAKEKETQLAAGETLKTKPTKNTFTLEDLMADNPKSRPCKGKGKRRTKQKRVWDADDDL